MNEPKPDGYDFQNERFVAGLRRLLAAVKAHPIQIRLWSGDDDAEKQSHPQPKSPDPKGVSTSG